VPNFVSFAASIAELAHGEKSRTQSLNHSLSLFDAPGSEVQALWNTSRFSFQKFLTLVL